MHLIIKDTKKRHLLNQKLLFELTLFLKTSDIQVIELLHSEGCSDEEFHCVSHRLRDFGFQVYLQKKKKKHHLKKFFLYSKFSSGNLGIKVSKC